jgi:ATP-dependent Lon protease
LSLIISALRGEKGLYLPPVLLAGPAGIGKSQWCRALSGHLGTAFLASDATGEAAPWSVIGMQRGWGSAEPGRLLSTILAERLANPLVFIDEIEKAGLVRSRTGSAFSLTAGLLPLLERSTARTWTCPFYRMSFDMSHVSWVMAANSLHGLSAPFLSRLTVILLDGPTPDDLVTFAHREGRRRGLSDEAIDAAAAAVQEMARRQRINLRDVQRRLDLAEALEARPWVQ